MLIENDDPLIDAIDLNAVQFFDARTTVTSDIANLESSLKSLEIAINEDRTDTMASSSNRMLRPRRQSATDQLLHRTTNRTITRAKRRTSLQPTSQKDIEDFYLRNELDGDGRVNLETIFENDDIDDEVVIDPNMSRKLFGRGKLKRSLSCSDGINISKTVRGQRKRRIKSRLGAQRRWKKIPMDVFKAYMQKMLEGDSTTETLQMNEVVPVTSTKLPLLDEPKELLDTVATLPPKMCSQSVCSG